MVRFEAVAQYLTFTTYCSVGVGVALLAVCPWMGAEWLRLSPLYQDLECKITSSSVVAVRPLPPEVDLDVNLVCTNPNPYIVAIAGDRSGKAFVEGVEVGTVQVSVGSVPAGTAREPGASKLALQVTAGVVSATSVLASGGASELEVLFELVLNLVVAADIMSVAVPFATLVTQYCGLKVAVLPEVVVGMPDCADSFGAVRVPDIEGPGLLRAGFKPNINKEVVQEGEKMRDLVFGCSMAGFILVGGAFLARAAHTVRRAYREARLELGGDDRAGGAEAQGTATKLGALGTQGPGST